MRAQWAGETSRGRKSPHLGVWGLTEFLKFFWLWITFTNTLVETPTHPHRDSLKHSDTHPNTDRHTHTQPEKTHTKTQAKRLRFIWLTFDLTLKKKRFYPSLFPVYLFTKSVTCCKKTVKMCGMLQKTVKKCGMLQKTVKKCDMLQKTVKMLWHVAKNG